MLWILSCVLVGALTLSVSVFHLQVSVFMRFDGIGKDILLKQAFSSNFLFSPVMMAWPMYQINIILYARLHLYTAAASIKAWKKSNAKTWRCERCAFATMRSIVGPSLLNQMVAFFCSIYVTFVSFSIYLLYVCHTHFHPTLALSLSLCWHRIKIIIMEGGGR